MSLSRHHGFCHSSQLPLQISGVEQRRVSGAGNVPKPGRQQCAEEAAFPAGFAGSGAFRQAEPSVPAGQRSRAAIATCWVWPGNCRAGMAPGGWNGTRGPAVPGSCRRPWGERSGPGSAQSHRRSSLVGGAGSFLTNCASKQALNIEPAFTSRVRKSSGAAAFPVLLSDFHTGGKTPWNEICCLHLSSPSLGKGDNRNKAITITCVAPFVTSFSSKTKETRSQMAKGETEVFFLTLLPHVLWELLASP